jgi:LDH2 family malate/lactate/ureidoglycolate dehydrogenase
MPGEKALLRRDETIKNGISYNQEVLNTLEKLSEKFKINL